MKSIKTVEIYNKFISRRLNLSFNYYDECRAAAK